MWVCRSTFDFILVSNWSLWILLDTFGKVFVFRPGSSGDVAPQQAAFNPEGWMVWAHVNMWTQEWRQDAEQFISHRSRTWEANITIVFHFKKWCLLFWTSPKGFFVFLSPAATGFHGPAPRMKLTRKCWSLVCLLLWQERWFYGNLLVNEC